MPWTAVDAWFEEGRKLVHYPPNPYHRVDCRPTKRRLRVTFADSILERQYVWPGRHAAGSFTAGGIPFGAVMRLRSDFAIPASWTTQAKAVATAMKRYGVYVSDIGSNSFITGEPSANWQSSTISQLQQIQMSSFEFVNIGNITGDARFNGNSYQASW